MTRRRGIPVSGDPGLHLVGLVVAVVLFWLVMVLALAAGASLVGVR